MAFSSSSALVCVVAACVMGSASAQGACVVEHCAIQLAECEADAVCRAWSSCTKACPPTEEYCQMRCGDVYKPTNSSGKNIDKFSECVITDHHCIPQKRDDCPLPAKTVASFDLSQMTGIWFAVKGLNPMFDCFDCQRHSFHIDDPSEPKPLHADLHYKVKKDLNCTEGSCEYLDRLVHNQYSQDPTNPAHLANHNNTDPALLGYTDDWYILSADMGTSATDPNAYVLIYYCGCNDAWCGFQGSVLYLRTPTYELSPTATKAINSAMVEAKILGYTSVDNFCSSSNKYCGFAPTPSTPTPAPVPTPKPAPTPGPAPGPAGAVWKCTVCAHVYNPAKDASPAPAGTAFEDLPAKWICPVCGAAKSAYKKQTTKTGSVVWAH